MVRSVVRKKRKRQFYGNKHTIQNVQNIPTASSSKLADLSFDVEIETPPSGNRILDLKILQNIFTELCCPTCYSMGLDLCEDSKYGLCSHFVLKCNSCDFSKGFASTDKSGNSPQINTRLVYGMRQLGKGHSGAYKLCATLNLPPPPNKSAYSLQEEKILCAVTEIAQESMAKAAAEVKNSTKGPECGVSVDGTWQRRGYTSLNGCVAAISVDTGKVLDVEVMSAYCPTCKRLQKMKKGKEYDSLKADHICRCNHNGSAKSMEPIGASRIFKRSESLRGLKYTSYYGDGDSSAFDVVKNMYGENSVAKLECIGHIQKRVGTRLRKLKKGRKGLSGKGNLTDSFIDRLQNYYGIAIRSNVGNLNMMQQNAIAVLFHCASTNAKPMHGQCPRGKDSWCFFQRAVEAKVKPRNKYPGLPSNVLNAVKPVYMELCSRELLAKCLHGKTQNPNESFNGNIWQRVPKEVFVCLKTLRFGVYDAVIQFNDGYQGCLNVFQKLYINNENSFTEKQYIRLDRQRILESIRHSTPTAKKNRKVLRALRKQKTTTLESKEVPPTIVPDPAHGKAIVRKGNPVTLLCDVSGSPRPIVTWTYDHQGEESSSLPSGVRQVHGTQLQVASVDVHHSGVYKCTADNDVGDPVSATFNMTILYAPDVVVKPEWLHGDEGVTVEFLCTCNSMPISQVHWVRGIDPKHGQPLKPNQYVKLTENMAPPTTTEAGLKIQRMRREDLGSYTCVAKNSVGLTFKTVEVSGLAEPVKLRGTESGESSFQLLWTAKSYSPVMEYQLKIRKYKSGDAWTDVVIPVSGDDGMQQTLFFSQRYNVTGLEPGSKYEAVLQAHNDHGWNRPSDTLLFSAGTSSESELEDEITGRSLLPFYDADLDVTDPTYLKQDASSSSTTSPLLIFILVFFCLPRRHIQ